MDEDRDEMSSEGDGDASSGDEGARSDNEDREEGGQVSGHPRNDSNAHIGTAGGDEQDLAGDDECGPVDGPTICAQVFLRRKKGAFIQF